MYKISITIILLLLSLSSYSQKYPVIDVLKYEYFYDYTILKDSTDRSREDYQEMILRVGEHSSKFISSGRLYKDSLLRSVEHLDPAIGFSKIWPKISRIRESLLGKFIVYKNYPEKGVSHFIGSLGSKLELSVNEKNIFDWQYVSNSDTTIMNYACSKATCTYGGRQWEAWFTSEIPLSDGPYKFKGLPGLIVRLADTKKEHVFQMYKVNQVDKHVDLIYYSSDNLSETTRTKFLKAKDIYFKDLYVKFGGNPNIKYSDPAGESQALRNIRGANNFIEKY